MAAFFGADSAAEIAGDVAMLASEVTPVLKALRNNGLNVVAIHNHMTEGEPVVYFCIIGARDRLRNLPEGSEPRSINSAKAKALTAPNEDAPEAYRPRIWQTGIVAGTGGRL